MIQATLNELDLNWVAFPPGFTPRFYAGHDPWEEGVCWWHVFDSEPKWVGGYWKGDGGSYEIGSYYGEDKPPEMIAGLLPECSLVKILKRE